MSTVRRVRSSSHLPSATAPLRKTSTRVASSGYIKNSHIRSGSNGSHESAVPAPSADYTSLVRKFSTLVLRNTHDELTDAAPADHESANGYLPAIVLGPHGAFQRLVYIPRTEGPGVRVLYHANASDVGVPPPPPVVPTLLTQPLPQLPKTAQVPERTMSHEPPSTSASAPPLRAEEKVPHSPSLESSMRQVRDNEGLRATLREWQGAFGAFVPRDPAEYMDLPRSATPPRPRQLCEPMHRSPRMAQLQAPLTPLENASTQTHGQSPQHNAEDKWRSRHLTAVIRAFFRDGTGKQEHYWIRDADNRPPSSDTEHSNQSGESCTAGTSVASPYELSPDPSLIDIKSTCNSTTYQPGRQRTKRSFRDFGRWLNLNGSHQ